MEGTRNPARTIAARRNLPLLLRIVFLLLLSVGVYAATVSHGLLWDDPSLIRYAEEKFRAGGVGSLLSAEFSFDVLSPSTPTGYYRPLALLSLLADSRLAHMIPVSFHLSNVLLHALTTVLVLLAAREVYGLAPGRSGLRGPSRPC